jgi:hypothetical protein
MSRRPWWQTPQLRNDEEDHRLAVVFTARLLFAVASPTFFVRGQSASNVFFVLMVMHLGLFTLCAVGGAAMGVGQILEAFEIMMAIWIVIGKP